MPSCVLVHGRAGSTGTWVWEAREYMYVGMGGQGVHVRGYGRAGSTCTWVWEGREYRYVGMGGQGVQVRGRGRAGSTGMWAWECKSILICRNPERLYHSLDLKLKGASEYIGTNNSKPLLISPCPLIFQLHTYDTDSRVLSMLMKTSYTISNKHQPSLLRSWC